MSKPAVGLIGLGNMGRPMAERLLQCGFSLTVLDRRREAAELAASKGARIANSLSDLAAGCDVIITMLPDSPQVEEVILGAEGLVHAAKPGAIIIDMSTISPATARLVATTLAERQVAFLDAPVSGGPPRAAAGSLTIMVGGDSGVLEACRPVLDSLGSLVLHMGPAGSGQVVKLCNNLVGGIIMLANAEALTLGVKAGVRAEALREVLLTSTGGNYLLENWVPHNIMQDRYQAGFALDLLVKDLGLAVALGKELKVPLMAGALAQQVYGLVSGLGHGASDFTVVSTLYQDAAGVTIATGAPRATATKGGTK